MNSSFGFSCDVSYRKRMGYVKQETLTQNSMKTSHLADQLNSFLNRSRDFELSANDLARDWPCGFPAPNSQGRRMNG
jgi:hypothetical protein